ncbi:hypothetical protein C8R43DRAFT_1140989 [Mycena crocata]|nr:hypothetical protein C8R43DRAFT_1140989 [Mycena crocata]
MHVSVTTVLHSEMASFLSQISDSSRRRVNEHTSRPEDNENQAPGSGETPGHAQMGRTPFEAAQWHSRRDSILGRRGRSPGPGGTELDQGEWSRHTKVLLREYASERAVEYGVPEARREDFIEACSLSTHKLLIVMLAAVLGGHEDSVDDKLKQFLLSSDFKEHVVGQIRSVLLDPGLSSYKSGFLERLLVSHCVHIITGALTVFHRHIRLNPGTYRIPPHLRSSITSRVFVSTIGAEATTARSEIKRKLLDGHTKKLDLVFLGKVLAWNNTQEMTDTFWGRMAWLSEQFYLMAYPEGNKNQRGFWDAVDIELAQRREDALEFPEDQRAALSSVIFEESLKTHIKEFPPKKGKPRAGKQLPEWQKTIARAVEEMEMYPQEELAGEESEDDNATPVDPDLDDQ